MKLKSISTSGEILSWGEIDDIIESNGVYTGIIARLFKNVPDIKSIVINQEHFPEVIIYKEY